MPKRQAGGGDDDDWDGFAEPVSMEGEQLEGVLEDEPKKKKRKKKKPKTDGWWAEGRPLIQLGTAEEQAAQISAASSEFGYDPVSADVFLGCGSMVEAQVASASPGCCCSTQSRRASHAQIEILRGLSRSWSRGGTSR